MNRRFLVIVTMVSVLASSNGAHADVTSPEMPYRRGAPPSGYHEERRMRLELVIPGASAFALAYGTAIYTGATSSDMNWLFVPLIGPFAAADRLSHRPTPEDCCTERNFIPIWIALDGVVQVAGVALATAGVLARKRWWVHDVPESGHDASLATWSVVPRASATGVGIQFVMIQ